MALKEKSIDINGFSKLIYVTRKKDDNGNIVPYVSVNGSLVTEETITLEDGNTQNVTTMIELPDGSQVAAFPVIILLAPPALSQDYFVTHPRVEFKTGVFLHIDQAVSYTAKEQSGNNNPDRTFLFRIDDNGLYIQDTSKGSPAHFTPENLVALGVISNVASWNYKAKLQSWFEPEYRTPTFVKPRNQFLIDIAKIPLGKGLLNGDAWDM